MSEPVCAIPGCGGSLSGKKNRGRIPIYCSNKCRIQGERAKRRPWDFANKAYHKLTPYPRLPGD